MVILQKRRKEIEGIINKKVKRVSLKTNKGKKERGNFNFSFQKEEKKKRMKNSPTKFHDLPANLSGSEHAARDGERSRC